MTNGPATSPSNSTSRFCKRCNYPLDGLTENRCAECGRNFDPANQFTYRTRPSTWLTTALRRAAALTACCLVLAIIWLFGTEAGTRNRMCERCGAISSVQYVNVLGLEREYAERIYEGPTSKFIHRHTHGTCNHRWEFFQGNFGPLFVYGGCCLGHRARRKLVDKLDDLVASSDEKLFDRITSNDPTFPDRLIQTIRRPTKAKSSALFDEVFYASIGSTVKAGAL